MSDSNKILIYMLNQNDNYICVNTLNHIYYKTKNFMPNIIVLGFVETKYGLQYYFNNSKLSYQYSVVSKIRLNGIGYYGIRGISLYILVLKGYTNYKILDNNIYSRFNYQYFTKGLVGIKMLIDNLEYLFLLVNLPDKITYNNYGMNERMDSLETVNNIINNHKNVFIFGSLNFRLHYLADNVLEEICLNNKEDIKELHNYDELYICIKEYYNDIKLGSIKNPNSFIVKFSDYYDNPQFPPSCKIKNDKLISIKSKYAKIKDIYLDNNLYWGDRIITNSKLKCLFYGIDDDLLINYSDHLPIYSIFSY